MMTRPSNHDRETSILLLWERAVGLSRWQRDDALFSEHGALPRGLGARNAALLGVRSALFGTAWPLKSRCPACGCDCEFEIDSPSLAEELDRLVPRETSVAIACAGQPVVLRAPDIDDLRAISHLEDDRKATRALLSRCLSGDLDLSGMDEEAIDDLATGLEALDPAAVVTFGLSCPACAGEWSAVIDVGDALWTELRHAAERSLMEVDALARTYGWTEDQVMGLSPTRRAAYLQLSAVS
jgi:hypothetical protein